ncbi:YggT family protein [Chondromyces crocatus]|uniref:YggT family protein n=1 Tax=Chondromyces crocatus TaxID=52 RepID=A0A0K1EP39_CHOCO|nr:YggT family protein [Chondromyces crocatus]AKT42680.1 uncharacterized protein CMC5_069070 [Chondromyces crocatus]
MGILGLVSFALWVIELAVLGRVVGSWLGADPDKPFMKALHTVTEPLFQLVRPLARRIPGPIDWTPAIVILGLSLLSRVIH